MTGAQKADDIHNNWVLAKFTSTGPAPNWIILNEISAGNWPGNQSYRNWLVDCLQRLNQFYGYNVIVASPFPNPGANDADWQRVATYSYIAIEQYLSGREIRDAGFLLTWCESQYRGSKQSYNNRGVSSDRLFLIEHFGQTKDELEDGTLVTWGRNNVVFADWERALNVRHDAARNVGFRGFVSFAWGKNAMLVSDDEMVYFEKVYTAKPLP